MMFFVLLSLHDHWLFAIAVSRESLFYFYSFIYLFLKNYRQDARLRNEVTVNKTSRDETMPNFLGQNVCYHISIYLR